jgi:hypothetical protein
MKAPQDSFAARVTRSIARPGPGAPQGVRASILAQAARLQRPMGDEATAPTGFDPAAAMLFEATLEAAYLVALADAPLDAREDAVLRAIVDVGCDGKMTSAQTDDLLAELAASVAREGAEQRYHHLAQLVAHRDHQGELLRIAAIMAQATSGIGAEQRAALERLAAGFSRGADAVQAAIDAAIDALHE